MIILSKCSSRGTSFLVGYCNKGTFLTKNREQGTTGLPRNKCVATAIAERGDEKAASAVEGMIGCVGFRVQGSGSSGSSGFRV